MLRFMRWSCNGGVEATGAILGFVFRLTSEVVIPACPTASPGSSPSDHGLHYPWASSGGLTETTVEERWCCCSATTPKKFMGLTATVGSGPLRLIGTSRGGLDHPEEIHGTRDGRG
ncbi:hypothetical protein DVH24_027572 [Malus domestica]|uniref:Uncharacterized protein n=1 Tax=Malus domestica TaxID=3750 RepID=A0A498HDB3_MALDO|nr:hypothetical protein DVH24_027572 [Malus domestica]